MKKAVSLSKDYTPSALLNNYGLLELEHGSPKDAKRLFERALLMLNYELNRGSKIDGQSTTRDGYSVQSIIETNLEKARAKLNENY
jgi:hypothetical protein